MPPASEQAPEGNHRKLQVDAQQFLSLLDVLPAAAYTCDAEGLITYFNRQAVEVWGRTPRLNDPVDRFCGSFKLYAPDGTPIAHDQCWMALALHAGEMQLGKEIVVERPDGTRVTALAHASPLRGEAGRIIGAVNVLVDISDRRRADEAQSRLASIVESSNDAIVSKDLTGRITSWNAGAERLFGYTAKEMVGASILRIIPPERHGEERTILERIRRGERVEHFQTVRITKSGSRVDVSLAVSPIRDRSGRVIGASKVARDVSAQNRAAQALRQSEQRFREFMQHLPGLAWIKDAGGRYVFVNEAAERAFRRYCANVLGKHDDDIFPPETAAQFRSNDRQVLEAGTSGEAIEILEHDDGIHHSLVSKFPIPDPTGTPAMVGGIAIDITERRKAEQALIAVKDELAQQLSDLRRLHEMSARMSTTLEMQPILDETLRTAAAIGGTDLGLLSLCDHQEGVLRIGASLGFDAGVLVQLDGVPIGAGACGRCCSHRERVVVEDVQTDPAFAEYREVAQRAGFRAVYSTPLVTRTGSIVGILATHFREPHRPSDRTMHLIDLCARQATDFIENARLYHELREADRRKDEFLATLAHELRNPLAPLSNSLQLLRLSDDLTPAVQHVREIMERQVNHMVRLVDDLLEVARITQGKIELRKELVELSTVIGSAVETSRPLIEAAGHQLAVTFSADSLVVEADSMRLAQVIANLLNNAAKFTPRGGQIWLTARREGDEAVVSVRDNGQGISAAMLPRVFDMFAQVDHGRSGSGLGIGLALARRLIQMHGGTIDATSGGIGQGSEFVVSLPLAIGARQLRASPGSLHAETQTLPSRRVLVVDDTESSAYVLGKLLETMGQTVLTADNAEAALRLVRSAGPDVIFSDLAMPGIDGYQLARRIRAEPSMENVVLVALTGYGPEQAQQRARDAGFDHYLVKPVEFERLKELLAMLPSAVAPSALAR